MTVKFEMKGLGELDKAFDDLINGVEDSLGDTLQKSSKPLFDKVKANAKSVDEKVKIDTVKNANSQAEVSVTSESMTKEYGTSTTAATPFMRPALDSTSGDVVENFGKEIQSKIVKIANK